MASLNLSYDLPFMAPLLHAKFQLCTPNRVVALYEHI